MRKIATEPAARARPPRCVGSRRGVDLNDDQTAGYLIGVEQNGDGYVEGSFTFTVTDD